MGSVPFFVIFILAAVFYALAKGGGPERATAIAFVVASVGSLSIGFRVMPGQFHSVVVRLFLVDILLLLGLCLIAIRANRWWVIPVAGCQLVAVLAHAGKLLQPDMFPRGYAFFVKLLPWLMVALLSLGTWAHRSRLSRKIIVGDWKPSSMPHGFRTRPALQSD